MRRAHLGALRYIAFCNCHSNRPPLSIKKVCPETVEGPDDDHPPPFPTRTLRFRRRFNCCGMYRLWGRASVYRLVLSPSIVTSLEQHSTGVVVQKMILLVLLKHNGTLEEFYSREASFQLLDRLTLVCPGLAPGETISRYTKLDSSSPHTRCSSAGSSVRWGRGAGAR